MQVFGGFQGNSLYAEYSIADDICVAFQKYDELQTQLKEFPNVIESIGNLIEQIAIQVEESDQNIASSIG